MGNSPLRVGYLPHIVRYMKQKPIHLLDAVEAFLVDHDMAPTTFGIRAVNDAKLVANLRAGLDVRTRTADRIRDFMKEYHKAPLARRRADPRRMAA